MQYTNLSEADRQLLETVIQEAMNKTNDNKELEAKNTIPENNIQEQIKDNTVRFSSAAWFDEIQKSTITVIGAGGIGSNALLQLARVNPGYITIYDHDKVENHNLAGQLYTTVDVGHSKCSRIAATLERFADYRNVNSIVEQYNYQVLYSNIVICGLDNMTGRKHAFQSWLSCLTCVPDKNKHTFLFIDGRLSAEYFQVFCIKGDEIYLQNKYAKHYLFDDSEADETICSYKQTSFCANMIGSIITNLVVNHAANISNPEIPRELPFLTEYDCTTMLFKTSRV